MLQLTIEPQELFDEKNDRFFTIDGCILLLEHSLISLHKWEAKWELPFLSDRGLTREQQIDYIRCMTLNEVPENAYNALRSDDIKKAFDYVKRKMTATVITDSRSKRLNNKTVTAEVIYYWMAALQIPFDPCERWHLNQLLTLIEVASIESQPPKKMSQRSILAQNSQLNRARRARRKSRG